MQYTSIEQFKDMPLGKRLHKVINGHHYPILFAGVIARITTAYAPAGGSNAANASLIADSPDMYELLRELVEMDEKGNIANMHHAGFPCQQSEKLQSLFTRATTLVNKHFK